MNRWRLGQEWDAQEFRYETAHQQVVKQLQGFLEEIRKKPLAFALQLQFLLLLGEDETEAFVRETTDEVQQRVPQ